MKKDYELSNVSFTTKNNYLSVTFDELNQKYYVKINDKCAGFDYSDGGIKTIYYDSKVKDNYLYIYEKAMYLDYSYDSNSNLVYNYHSGLDKNSNVVGNDYNSLNLSNFPTYVYKFEIKNNVYKFISVNNYN